MGDEQKIRIGVLSFWIGLFVQITGTAIVIGGILARVEQNEERSRANASLAIETWQLKAEMVSVRRELEGLKDDLREVNRRRR